MDAKHLLDKISYSTHFFLLHNRDWLRTAGARRGLGLGVTIYSPNVMVPIWSNYLSHNYACLTYFDCFLLGYFCSNNSK